MDTCETCGHSAPAETNRCRFERACSCWRGVPCRKFAITTDGRTYRFATLTAAKRRAESIHTRTGSIVGITEG